MRLVPNMRLIALTFLLAGFAQPCLADGSPPADSKAPNAKSLTSGRMVQIKPDTGNAVQNPRPRGPLRTAGQKPGSCQKSKPAFADADFSFQGYDDAGIRC